MFLQRRFGVAVASVGALVAAFSCDWSASNLANLTNLTAATVAAAEPTSETAVPTRPRKKLIELGWDIPTTDYLRRHWEKMEANAPFDGVIYDLATKASDGTVCSSQTLFTKRPWNRADFDVCVDDLKSCDFKRFRNNFIRINFYPVDFEWTDDDAWAAVSDKARICAEVARATNGDICFDFESYGKAMFKYDASLGLSFDEAKALARRRGAQFGGAIVDVYPDVVILALWLNSINFSAGKAPNPDFALRGGHYALLPAFIDGLLDAAAPETVLVDGCENGYYMNGASEYERAALDALLATGPGAALVSPENLAKYRAQVQIGFGFYLDMYSNPKGSTYYRGPEPGETRFDRMVANLKAAWNAADEYVWIYGEKKRWWPTDAEATAATVAPETKSQSWEEAIPGLTAALLELTNPQEAFAREKAAFEADPNAQNLLKNVDFADSPGPGKFADWGVWILEETPGETATVDGKAAFRGVENGCYIQSFPVEPGEKIFLSVDAKTTGAAIASTTARWQDAEGVWTEVINDVPFYAAPDAVANADGWTEISGVATVPPGARKLVFLLGAKGSGPNDVVVFNDARAYRRAKQNADAE